MIRTFSEEFDLPLERGPDRLGPFRTRYWFGNGGISSRSIGGATGKELQVYSDKAYNGVDPFDQWGDSLIITARPAVGSDPELGGKPYTSGLITTEKTFSQRYGRFVMKASLPMGAGLWPAFWLLPYADMTIKTAQKLSEIDIMECLGTPRVYFTGHHVSLPKVGNVPAGQSQSVKDMPVNYMHEYALEWTKDTVSWFVDGQMVRSIANIGWHEPMYMLANLAVGGWAGAVDAKALPARLQIDYIRAYQLG